MECVYSALFFLNTNQHLPREYSCGWDGEFAKLFYHKIKLTEQVMSSRHLITCFLILCVTLIH